MPYTLDQLEAFVSSAHYDSATAGMIAQGIPALKAAGADGELISPGVRRIRGNLCNVHGRYGPCDAGAGAKKPKGGKGKRQPAKPKQTDAQRAEARTAKRQANIDNVAKQMADNDTGLSPSGSKALAAFAQGTPPDAATGKQLAQMGLAEQAADGSYRMTPTGRGVVSAMAAGDYQRAVDGISRATDSAGKRTERQTAAQARQTAGAKRQQDAAGKRAAAQVARELAKRQPRPAKAGSKKPAAHAELAPETPRRAAKPKRAARSSVPSGGGNSGTSPKPKPKPAAPKPEKPTKEQATVVNRDAVRQGMAEADAALSPSGFDSLMALAGGTTPDPATATGLIDLGMAEQGSDGTLRLTSAARQVITAANRGDTKAAIDIVSRASEPKKTKAYTMIDIYDGETWITTKAQTAQDRAIHANMGGGGGSGGGGGGGGSGGAAGGWKKGPDGKRTPPYQSTMTQGRAQLGGNKDNVLREALGQAQGSHDKAHQISGHLSSGEMGGRKLGPADRQNLETQLRQHQKREASAIRRVYDETRRLRDAKAETKKDFYFRVFKDAQGRPRWVAQSSTAFQDRDREIVSTKALADDVAFADQSGSYGPLRWWHTPGLDLGDCDFNAMHGRVLVESGTFRSPAIAQKVAAAADGLEISLGFIHLPNEPDADGVFHHIRRFERSLVPRGKASNRFTAFSVKESRMFDPTKVAALKQLGFSDDDITGLQAQAQATEKAATDQGVAFKSVVDVPETMVVNGVTYKAALPPEEDMSWTVPQEVKINGVTYKAFPPKKDAEDAIVEEVIEEDAFGEMPMEDEAPADENALTLSAGDIAAISEAIQAAVATIMGGLDLEKKVASHVQGFLAPMQQAQTTKDAEQAATKEQLAALKQQVAELTGDQPATGYRASQAKDNIISDAKLLEAVKAANPNAGPFDDIIQGLGLARPQ